MQTKIDLLAVKLEAIKDAENRLKTQRIRLENDIAGMVATKLEGTDTVKTGLYKIKVTSKITREIDAVEWDLIKGDIPDYLSPVVMKPSLVMKKYRAIEEANPLLFNLISRAITSKPAKASVEVTRMIDEEAA